MKIYESKTQGSKLKFIKEFLLPHSLCIWKGLKFAQKLAMNSAHCQLFLSTLSGTSLVFKACGTFCFPTKKKKKIKN